MKQHITYQVPQLQAGVIKSFTHEKRMMKCLLYYRGDEPETCGLRATLI